MLTYSSENIIALATPPGIGALAIVRLSGIDLDSTYRSFTQKDPVDRKAVFSKIYHPTTNKLLDEAIIIYFKSPRSFTGEDVIEITCHGGMLVPRTIIAAAIDSGIRNASPGEFSFRAFVNGKIDLLQAEAISTLISSKSQLSIDVSLEHLMGRVSTIIYEIKEKAINILSIIENELDFSDNEITFLPYNSIRSQIYNIKIKLETILKETAFGRSALSGIRVVILGKPNTGKSSLFNSIIGFDRAIVSDTPGTTRDTVEYYFELDGVAICLVDTAGIWESKEFLDQLAVEKTMSALEDADVCFLVDDKDPTVLLKSNLLCQIEKGFVLIKSKSDLNGSLLKNGGSIFSISTKSGRGIDKLLTYLSTYISENVNSPDVLNNMLITLRQRNLIEGSLASIDDLIEQIDAGVESDVLASGLRGFVIILKDVFGEIPNEDILNNIFSNFCVGK